MLNVLVRTPPHSVMSQGFQHVLPVFQIVSWVFVKVYNYFIILKLFLNFKISKRKGRQKRKRLNTIDLGWGAILALQGWGGGCYEFGENIGYRLRSCLKGIIYIIFMNKVKGEGVLYGKVRFYTVKYTLYFIR